jgi:PIN domain nuclease of toxin-antitoxin system
LEPDFGEKMKKDLLDAKYAMKTFFKEAGHSHCVVMYPAKDMEDVDLANVWGKEDPTLPLPQVFDKMAAAIKVTELRADPTRKKWIGSSQEGPPPKRAKY